MEQPRLQQPQQTHQPQQRPPPRRRNRGRGNQQHGPSRAEHTENSQSATSSTHPSRRAFGSRLTQPSLDAGAPDFVPASLPPRSASAASSQASRPAKQPSSRPQQKRGQRKASISRSIAPDIATRTHEDINKGIYECAICSNEIQRSSKVWSCHQCWTVFHIGCIKKWSKNDASAVKSTGSDSEGASGKLWRCPGCNLPTTVLPSAYSCWCEKELDPKTIGGLPPHSCGQTCGRERKFPKTCPHPCDLICHAGPCPPCSATGPKQMCYCGKEETQRRCVETKYDIGWSCGAICGDSLPCGDHICQRPCHAGLCGACPVEIKAKCYCGRVEMKMPCSDQDDEKESYDWVGVFDCKQTCDRLYDCGEHRCEERCHPQESPKPHCPRSPDLVTHCACGKSALVDLGVRDREKCTDAIPSCKQSCGKTLACGHSCTQICHPGGDCLPCMRSVDISCRCGRNTFKTICHQGVEELPQCMRSCKTTLNCGRHECGERCCTGERKAIERLASKRKMKPLGTAVPRSEVNIEAEHICTRECGRPLKCGNHDCTDLCHRGPCGSCKEAIFDDISCNCGRTVLQAPLPCGTSPPPCNFPCRRPTTCGHPVVAHNCHMDDEDCPKCPFLTEKKCMCGKRTLKNQPCWRSDGLCGLVCGQTLKCGSHTCRKTCHKSGECEDAHEHCQQECGKAKKTCGHPCEKVCHAPSVCKEDRPCPFKVIITCDCQRKKEEVRCNARATVADPPGRQTSLKCDEECARLERNKNLASALHIPEGHLDDHVPYSTATLNMYLEDVPWAHKQEETLRVFAADDEEKRYRFPPMKSRQRQFLHSVAEDFGLDSESVDPEPHRHIMLFKTPRFVSAPMKTLAQAARIRRGQLAIAAPIVSAAMEKKEPVYNAFLLRGLKFALTEEELRAAIKMVIPASQMTIHFLADEVALIPQTKIDLSALQPTLSTALVTKELVFSVLQAKIDVSDLQPKVVDVQTKSTTAAGGGWSQVAAAGGKRVFAPTTRAIGQKPIYTVLGTRAAEAKKKKADNEKALKLRKEDVVDDWETEMESEPVAGATEQDGPDIAADVEQTQELASS